MRARSLGSIPGPLSVTASCRRPGDPPSRMASESARALYNQRPRIAETTFGIMKFVMGVRQFLLRGLEKVKTEWLWAATAFNLMKLAREIVTKSPDAVRAAKRLFNESGLGSVQEGFVLESELQKEMIGSPNQLEAVRANMEKSTPVFKDPE